MNTVLHGVALMTQDIASCAAFYRQALDFTLDASGDGRTLLLGAQRIVLTPATGAAYPEPRASNDPWFQHLAIVVTDIAAAYAQAMAQGATAISTGGPQHLPASSGGVTAWKFRDPEGHPLELLQFPPDGTPARWQGQSGLFLGIDHTAIVVSDTAASEAFYGTLGFRRTAQTHNHGPAQTALDGLATPHVLVTALALPGEAAPHVELLDYFTPPPRSGTWDAGDVAATRMIFAGSSCLARDPDGHYINLRD